MISKFLILRSVHLSGLIKGKNTLPIDEMWQLADVRTIAANGQTRMHMPIESIKTTYMGYVNTGVLEKIKNF